MTVEGRTVPGSIRRRDSRIGRRSCRRRPARAASFDPRVLPEVFERASLSQQSPEVFVEPRDMKEGSEVEMFADPSDQLGGKAEQAGQRSLRTKTLS